MPQVALFWMDLNATVSKRFQNVAIVEFYLEGYSTQDTTNRKMHK